jgi:hypothetical protein
MHSRKAREESPQTADQHGDNLGDGHRSSRGVCRGSHRASSRRGVLARLRDRFLTQSDAAPALIGRELSLPVRAHDEAPLTGRVLSELDGQAWFAASKPRAERCEPPCSPATLAKLSCKPQLRCAVLTGQ